jgi:hypothetical protein
VERYPAQSNPAISKLQPFRAIARVRHRLGFPLAFFGSLLASFNIEHGTGSTPPTASTVAICEPPVNSRL